MRFRKYGLAVAVGGFMLAAPYWFGGPSAGSAIDPLVPRAGTHPVSGIGSAVPLVGTDDLDAGRLSGRSGPIATHPETPRERPVASLQLAQREPSRSVTIRPPGAVPRAPGSRTIRRTGTYRGQPGSVAVTVTPEGDIVQAEVTGGIAEARGWDLFWNTLRKRIEKCKEKYPPGKERNACIDDAILGTIGDLITGDL